MKTKKKKPVLSVVFTQSVVLTDLGPTTTTTITAAFWDPDEARVFADLRNSQFEAWADEHDDVDSSYVLSQIAFVVDGVSLFGNKN